MNKVIDTSVRCAYFLESDPLHEKAMALFTEQQILDHEIFFHTYLLEEICTLLTYKKGVALTKQAVLLLQEYIHENMIIIPENKLLQSFFKINKKISLADVAIVMTALYTQSELMTFDKQQLAVYNEYKSFYAFGSSL